ncbi:kinase-like domain-containing protein [Xylaria palmicola]|nr:kinase-like domain-containing protein [Xylaria palmicola]
MSIPHEDQQSTNPFSEGHVERRLLELPSFHPLGDKDASTVSLPGEASKADQSGTPICNLEAHHLHCRVLIQPHDPSSFKSQPNHREYLRPVDAGSHETVVECIAITQTPKETCCMITEPRCRLYYDSQGDSITIVNLDQLDAITISRVVPTGPESLIDATISPMNYHRVEPGAWVVRFYTSSTVPPFQFILYPRAHSLSILNTETAQPSLAGSKRKRNDITKQPRITSVIQKANNLSEIKAGETIQVATQNVEEYRIQRLQNATSNTRNSTVYKAKVTMYPKELVVVKLIKGESALFRARLWDREFSLHSKLRCDVIVPLLGGDARLDAIYLKSINAYDLGHKFWRQGFYFTGDKHDATCILKDMAQALDYLKQNNIVHHDIKPANILYDQKTGAVLIDFGLGTCGPSLPHYGGTPWYIGPEYLGTDCDRRSPEDVWALGIVMLYLLRLISLPEAGHQVKDWLIKHAREPSSNAHNSMKEWIGVIQRVAKEKLKEGDNFHDIVRRMLTLTPGTRILPSEITEALHISNGT